MAQRAARALSDCSPVHVTVDTTGAALHVPFDQGRGYGEIILAADTLVTSVTFWVPHQYDNFFMQGFLFITVVDSNGASAHFPETTNVVYASQLVTPPLGDGVHLRPFSFTLTPPAALPKPGEYFFLLSEGTCFGGILLLAQDGNPYPNGLVWETGTSDCSGRGPGTPTSSYPTQDLCMDVTFCDTHSTPVLRGSWGELKTRYH
jgi:hypothetical protein